MNENNLLFDVNLAGEHYGVFFFHKNIPVFSANKTFMAIATFESPIITGDEGFVSWKNIETNYIEYTNTNIYIYIKNFEATTDEETTQWVGPILQKNYNIDSYNKKNMKIKVVLAFNEGAVLSPVLESIYMSYYKLGSEEKFFTKAFDIGFKPQDIILTYNGEISKETLLQFAIAPTDTTNQEDFHIIEPNKIQSTSDWSWLGDKFKIMVSGLGERNVPFVLDEFGIMFSGKDKVEINQ